MSGPNLSAGRKRGQPIIVLVAVLAVWSAVRFATWATPFPVAAGEAPMANLLSATVLAPAATQTSTPDEQPGQPVTGSESLGDPAGWRAPRLPEAPAATGWNDPASVSLPASGQDYSTDFEPVAPRMAAGHTLLMAAGFAQMEVPPQIAAYLSAARGSETSQASAQMSANAGQAVPFPVAAPASQSQQTRRWSVDGWLLWREDSNSPLFGDRPSYGRSQIGAVLRYNLAPSSARRPQAHVRASSTLEGRREREMAAGLSARPIAKLPLRVAAEVRASVRNEGSELRPAVYAVTELPPQQLPAGLQAEAYLQGGYVGGDFATAFVDGQARVDGSLASADGFDLRAGAGIWGGAQEDAKRLDIGPSAALTFRVGEGHGRLAADYRIRVAGDAQPSSGPALTLSTGF